MAEVALGELEHTVSSYKWTINNYLATAAIINKKTGESVISPVFKITTGIQDFSCRLQLYPKGDSDEHKDYLSVRVLNDNTIQSDVPTDAIQVSVINDQNSIICQRRMTKTSFTKYHHFSFHRLIDFQSLRRPHILVNGALVIQLDVIFDARTILRATVICRSSPVLKTADRYKLKCNDDYEQLLDNEKFSDVKFVIGDKTIYSHKAVLSTRSQVFRRMFESELKESRMRKIEITDVKYEVMKELLRFVYSSKINKIAEIVGDLLVAADKYSIDDLKALCEKSLYDSLNTENAIKYLIIASSCNTTQLKSQIIQFINDHPDIVDKQEFKMLPSDIMYEVVPEVTRKRVKVFTPTSS